MLLASGLPEAPLDLWAVEVKWDGLRAQLRVQRDGAWSMRTRPGSDRSARFPELAGVAQQLAGHDVVIDGELVCLARDGKPDFAAVRRRLVGSRQQPCPVTLIAFDLLHLDGWNLRGLPYEQRREQLHDVLADGQGVRVPEHWIGEVDAIAAITREHELEGVVCKRLGSPYRGTRSSAWRKHKHRRREQLAVTGWRPGEGEPDTVYLARVDASGRRRAVGAAQFGLGADARARLRDALAARQRQAQRRSGIRAVDAGITVVVDAHGRRDGWLRDPVLRDVVVERD